MIPLVKGAEPDVLVQNSAQWNADYIAFRAGELNEPAVATRHRHPAIKQAVIAETFGKCAYCETKALAAQFGDVEHIAPKATYPERYADWDNLTLACVRCNNAKRENEGFVNPYIDNVADHLQFRGPLIAYSATSPAGQLTVRGLRLNRPDLLQQRAIAIQRFMDLLDLRAKATGALKDTLEAAIEEALDSSSEYSATLRAFYDSFDQPQDDPAQAA